MGGCQSESCSETLRMQCGEDGVGRRKSGPIAVECNIRAFSIVGDWKEKALGAEV